MLRKNSIFRPFWGEIFFLIYNGRTETADSFLFVDATRLICQLVGEDN
jgi:hypothetical protein